MPEENIHWIAVDWGTSNLRASAVSESGQVLDRLESDRGMASVNADTGDFESALLEVVDPWLETGRPIPVIACGMVGARQGWIEVPYETAPCSPETRLTRAPTEGEGIAVWICSGVQQETPADVMRGEETQLSGLLEKCPDFEGTVCLPGTHSKWATIRSGKIRKFQTFLTGELFTLLAEKSVLRHSVSDSGWDESAFLEGVHSTFENPATFSARLFALRAEDLLKGTNSVTSRSRLAGLLAGLEFSGIEILDGKCALIGAPEMLKVYDTGLRSIGFKASLHDADELTLAGLRKKLHSPDLTRYIG